MSKQIEVSSVVVKGELPLLVNEIKVDMTTGVVTMAYDGTEQYRAQLKKVNSLASLTLKFPYILPFPEGVDVTFISGEIDPGPKA